MAEKYWYGTRIKPVERALRNIDKFSAATIAGTHTTDETVSIEFASALTTGKKNGLDRSMRAVNYDFRRQETI